MWERERGLDCQSHHAEEVGVGYKEDGRRHEQVQDKQGAGEVGDEGPIWTRIAPLPEVVGAIRGMWLEGQVRGRRAVGKGDMQEQEVDEDHEKGLDEQRSAKVCAEPVVDFEDAGDKHDERYVEREAGGAAGTMPSSISGRHSW